MQQKISLEQQHEWLSRNFEDEEFPHKLFITTKQTIICQQYVNRHKI